MRTVPRGISPLITALLLCTAAPAAAQVSLGAGAGASLDAELTPGLSATSELEPGWLVGAQAEYWLGDSPWGARAAVRYADRLLEDGSGKYAVVTAELGPLVRFQPLAFLAPYATGAVGTTFYLAQGASPPLGDGAFGDNPVQRLHIALAGGAEMPLADRWHLSLELGDRIVLLPIGESPEADGFPLAHTPFALVGVEYLFGRGVERLAAAENVVPEPRPAMPADPERTEPETIEPAQAEPEPDPVVEPRPEAAPPAALEVRYTVQVASYMEPATAEQRLERVTSIGVPAWLIRADLGGTPTARLRVGSAPDAAAAGEIAAVLEREFGWEVAVEPIGADEPVPADAVERTRAYLARLSEGGSDPTG